MGLRGRGLIFFLLLLKRYNIFYLTPSFGARTLLPSFGGSHSLLPSFGGLLIVSIFQWFITIFRGFSPSFELSRLPLVRFELTVFRSGAVYLHHCTTVVHTWTVLLVFFTLTGTRARYKLGKMILAGFEPTTFGFRDIHFIHFTTVDHVWIVLSVFFSERLGTEF